MSPIELVIKNTTLLIALIVSILFSSTCYAEWTLVSINEEDNKFYLDFEQIKQDEGYVYYWELMDYSIPRHHIFSGNLKFIYSVQFYKQGNCETLQTRNLSISFHTEHMANGEAERRDTEEAEREWIHHPPNSIGEAKLATVCDYLKNN